MLVHIAELSTQVVEVAIKVINANSKSMFSICNSALNACWDTETTARDATEMNNDGMVKFGDVHYQRLQSPTEFINFSERDLINDDSSFCSHTRLAIDLQCHVFTFEKLLLNVSLCL